jgi:hypothetical protein
MTAIFVSIKATHVHSAVPGGQNAFLSSAFRCIPVYFVHQAHLNETKMAVGRENDE